MVAGFVGAGNMTGAIMNGILCVRTHPAQDMIVFDISEEKRSMLQQKRLRTVASVLEVVKDADIVLPAMKPQNFMEMLEEAKKTVTERARFVAVAAGIPVHYITSTLGCDYPAIRTMSNIPLLVGKGATTLCRSEEASDEDFALVRSISEVCDTVKILQEDQTNVATFVNDSDPAYVYLFAKAAVESADRQGIPVDAALRLFSQTLIDSAEMFLHPGHMPDEPIKVVSPPGGTTPKALDVLYSRGLEVTIDEAMLACTHRAEELGKQVLLGLLVKTIFFTP